MNPETKLKLKCLKYLKSLKKTLVWKLADKFSSGYPDLVVYRYPLLYGIELKIGKNKATKLQEYVLNQIRESGGIGVVCRSIEEVKQTINEKEASKDER